jgi:hypothetical protein
VQTSNDHRVYDDGLGEFEAARVLRHWPIDLCREMRTGDPENTLTEAGRFAYQLGSAPYRKSIPLSRRHRWETQT